MEQYPAITKAHVRVASGILTTIGLAYTYHALQLPLGNPPGTGVGAAPLGIGALWVAFGLYVTLRSPDIQLRDGEVGSWPNLEMAKRLALAIGLCTAFIAGLPFLGMIATSGLFLFLIGRVAGAPWSKALLSSMVFTAFFWVVFVKLLQVSLPEGSLLVLMLGA